MAISIYYSQSSNEELQNCHMFYRSWKYWHSPMIHGFAMTVVTAYDMYLECCEGNLEQEWKVDKPMDFYTFREKLSEQMLCYRPEKRCYAGDENHRKSKQQNSHQRRKMQKMSSPSDDLSSSAATSVLKTKVSCEQLKTELLGKRGKVPRLCQDLESLQAHVESAFKVKNKQICPKRLFFSVQLSHNTCSLKLSPFLPSYCS